MARLISKLISPATEGRARGALTALWFSVFGVNVVIVVVTLALGGFGDSSDADTQRLFVDAFQSVCALFSVHLSAIGTYWFGLRSQRSRKMKNLAAFRLSFFTSLLWATVVTGCHIFLEGFIVYSETLPKIAATANWLIVGTFAYYFSQDAMASRSQP